MIYLVAQLMDNGLYDMSTARVFANQADAIAAADLDGPFGLTVLVFEVI